MEVPTALRRGLPYEVRFTFQARSLQAPARVAWEPDAPPKTGPRRYGLEFTLTTSQEEALAAIVREIRLKLWA